MGTLTAALPPGPKGRIHQTFRYMRDPFAYYERMQARFGDLFTMPSMNGTLVITLTPDGAREILAGKESDFGIGFGAEAAAAITGESSLLLLSGERHRRERQLASPTFHGGRMRGFGPAMQRAALREIESWTPGQEIVLHRSMQSISLDVIVEAVFGVQSPERLIAFRTAIREAVDEVNPALIFFKFLQREFGGIGPWAKLKQNLARFDALIYEQIDEARRSTEPREDVLSKLMNARYEDGTPIDDKALRDHLVTLLVAGHETTSSTLSWALYEAHRHPKVLERLRDESSDLGSDADVASLSSAQYIEAHCRETLRVHPVLAEFFRTVKSSYRLQGWDVPAGVTLAGSIIMIHRDPSLYPEPSRFEPERFLERRFAPYEFVAFGGGFRHCLGAAFAMQEMKIVLASVFRQVELEPALDRPLKTVRRNLILAPEAGVPMVVRRRLASPRRAA